MKIMIYRPDKDEKLIFLLRRL